MNKYILLHFQILLENLRTFLSQTRFSCKMMSLKRKGLWKIFQQGQTILRNIHLVGITPVGQCLAQLTFHTVTTIHAHNEYILLISISCFI